MLTTKRALALVVSALGVAAFALQSAPAEADGFGGARDHRGEPPPVYATFPSHNAFGAGTRNMEEATAFCQKACDVNPATGGANCPRVPFAAEGFLQENDPSLHSIPKIPYVFAAPHVKATKEVIDGLERLSGYIVAMKVQDAALPKDKQQIPDFAGVRVNNCWRDARYDTQKECYFVMKGQNPQNLGLAYPGATPHSGGKACDITLVDKNGKEATACSAESEKSLGAALPFKTASDLLDRILTNPTVGAKRLNYEAWHYEWGGPDNARCVYPHCMQDHWPPLCRPGR